MKSVYLECIEVTLSKDLSKEGKKLYRCRFLSLPDRNVTVLMDITSPAVPGNLYEFLLKGVFPGFCDNRECVGSVETILLSDNSPLRGIDFLTKQEILEGKKK